MASASPYGDGVVLKELATARATAAPKEATSSHSSNYIAVASLLH
jgi:hypothetical protein